jgi:hypothetical protein
VLAEAEAQEVSRLTAAGACPADRRNHLAERHARARDQEVLRVQRLREEHAQLLAAAWRSGDDPGPSRLASSSVFRRDGEGVAGLYADKPVPDNPGTTSQVRVVYACGLNYFCKGGLEKGKSSSPRETTSSQKKTLRGHTVL